MDDRLATAERGGVNRKLIFIKAIGSGRQDSAEEGQRRRAK